VGQVVEYVWIDFGAFHMFGGKIDVFQTELYKLRCRINRRLLHSTYEIPSAALKKSLQRILERLPFSGETSFVSFSGESSNSGAKNEHRNCPLRVRRSTQTGTMVSDRVTFARCWDPNHVYYGDIYRDVNWLFAGSVFGGSGNAMQQFALRVREKCLQVLRERNTLMWEINIWVLIYREVPELFSLYPSDHSEILLRGYSKN